MGVSNILDEASEIYIKRNKEYGDTYKIHGHVINSLFPEGVTLQNYEDHVKFGVLTMMISKLTRISQNFHSGHSDSLLDLITYSAMLKELYEETKK